MALVLVTGLHAVNIHVWRLPCGLGTITSMLSEYLSVSTKTIAPYRKDP